MPASSVYKEEHSMSKGLVYIGVDVSKDSLDVFCTHDHPKRVPNRTAGFKTLIALVRGIKAPCVVCCEATGGYERNLMKTLVDEQVRIIRFNPKRVRDYAKSQGILAKTDRIDAKVIAEYAATHKNLSTQPRPTYQPELEQLYKRREQLLEMKQREKNRMEKDPHSRLLKDLQDHIHFLEQQIHILEEQIEAFIREQPECLTRYKRIIQIKGVGKVTAWAVLALFPEIGTLNRNQAASLAGVAPFNSDSGKKKGIRIIQGGRFALRKALYMSAMVAAVHNPILKAHYKQLVKQGKAKKLALTAIMRKLIILMNQLIRDPDFKLA